MVVMITFFFFASLFILAGVHCIVNGDKVGFLGIVAGSVLCIVGITTAMSTDSPIESATDQFTNVKECKLATIQDNDNSDCFVLRDSQGQYYFVIEYENKFGNGNSEFEPVKINGTKVIVVESETDDAIDAYVDIDSVEAKATAGSTGVNPIEKYTFYVPAGTIRFVENLPE